MTNSNVIERARQADPEAIAALMNHSLQSKGITASVARDGDRLEVLLDSDSETNRSLLTTFVSNGLKNLNVSSIRTATVRGTKQGSVVWEDTVSVGTSGDTTAQPTVSQSTVSQPTKAQPSPSPSGPASTPPPPPPSRPLSVSPPTPTRPETADDSPDSAQDSTDSLTDGPTEDPSVSRSPDRSSGADPMPADPMPSETEAPRGLERFGNFDRTADDLDEPAPPVPPGVSAVEASAVLSSPEVLVESLPSVSDELLEEQAQAAAAIAPPVFVPNVDAVDGFAENSSALESEPVENDAKTDAGMRDTVSDAANSDAGDGAESNRGPSRVLFSLVLLLLAAIVGGLIGYAVWSYLTGTSPLEELLPQEQQTPAEPLEDAPPEEPPTSEQPSLQDAPEPSPQPQEPQAPQDTVPQDAVPQNAVPQPQAPTEPAPQPQPEPAPQPEAPPAEPDSPAVN